MSVVSKQMGWMGYKKELAASNVNADITNSITVRKVTIVSVDRTASQANRPKKGSF